MLQLNRRRNGGWGDINSAVRPLVEEQPLCVVCVCVCLCMRVCVCGNEWFVRGADWVQAATGYARRRWLMRRWSTPVGSG